MTKMIRLDGMLSLQLCMRQLHSIKLTEKGVQNTYYKKLHNAEMICDGWRNK
jgi:hypothetical protein